MGLATKTDEFSEKFQKGVGVQKFMLQNLDLYTGLLSMKLTQRDFLGYVFKQF